MMKSFFTDKVSFKVIISIVLIITTLFTNSFAAKKKKNKAPSAVPSKISLDVDFSQKLDTNTAYYGRYLNIVGYGIKFNEQELEFYQKNFKTVEYMRVWDDAHVEKADKIAENIIMCIASFKPFANVLNKKMSEKQFIDYLKARIVKAQKKSSKIRIVEALNEFYPKKKEEYGFPKDMHVDDIYYKCYKYVQKAVAELNKELKIQLKVAAPVVDQFQHKKYNQIEEFVKRFCQDKDRKKQLDYFTIHTYEPQVSNLLTYREMIDGYFKKHSGKGISMPILSSEGGYKGWREHMGRDSEPIRQATGSIAVNVLLADQNIGCMHWVYPYKEAQFNMLVAGTLKITPKGQAIRLAQQLKEQRVKADYKVNQVGDGVYTVATYDKTGMLILVVSYDHNAKKGKKSSGSSVVREVTLNLKETKALRFKLNDGVETFVDSKRANYFYDKNGWDLKYNKISDLNKEGKHLSITRKLEDNSIWAIRFGK